MMSQLAEHLDLCAGFAAGSLDAVDRKRFAEHLADGCDECEQQMPANERAAVLLAAALPLSAPSPSLRDRVLTGLASGAPAPAAAPILPLPVAGATRPGSKPKLKVPQLDLPPAVWAIGGGVVLLLAIGFGVMRLTGGQVNHLRKEIASNSEVITGLNQQLQDAQMWAATYESPEARTARLVSTSRSDVTLHARALYDPRSERALIVFSDLRAPRGKVYQLWSIEGPRYTSLGVINTDSQGRAAVRVLKAGDANRLTDFGVTLEKAGGSSSPHSPNGPLVMIGHVEG